MIIFVDGAARGNPGPAAWAYVLMDDDGKILHQDAGYIGKETNNVAEYNAIISALNKAKTISNEKIKIFSDSQLAVRQLNGKYRIKASHLKKLAERVQDLSNEFERVEFIHVGRENPNIERCDALCNACLDAKNQ